MAELVRFTVRDKNSVVFEVDDPEPGIRQVARRGSKVLDVPISLDDQLAHIHDAAAAALAALRGGINPDEVKLSFSIKMTAEFGAVIARTSVEGNLGVEMRWQRNVPDTPVPPAAAARPA